MEAPHLLWVSAILSSNIGQFNPQILTLVKVLTVNNCLSKPHVLDGLLNLILHFCKTLLLYETKPATT